MYTVYGSPASRAIRVIWTLEELGEDYDLVPEPPRSDAILALNPTGKIPLLRDGELLVTDSVAIITYLADKHGKLTHPAGTAARARQDATMNYVVAELDAALWTYTKHSFVLPEERRVPAIKATAAFEFEQAMTYLERLRGDGPFLAGEMFTIADIVLSHCAGWGLSRKFPLPGGEFGDYLKSLRKRPAMMKVMSLMAAG